MTRLQKNQSLISSTRQKMGAVIISYFFQNGFKAYSFGNIVIAIDYNNIRKFRVYSSLNRKKYHVGFYAKNGTPWRSLLAFVAL